MLRPIFRPILGTMARPIARLKAFKSAGNGSLSKNAILDNDSNPLMDSSSNVIES